MLKNAEATDDNEKETKMPKFCSFNTLDKFSDVVCIYKHSFRSNTLLVLMFYCHMLVLHKIYLKML